MPILNLQIGAVGLSGINPQQMWMDTSDTVAQVTTAGYLNKLVSQNMPITTNMLANVSTKASASALPSPNVYRVTFSGGNWSLAAI